VDMLGHLRHRGPDGHGIQVLQSDGAVAALGHCRLAIIDPANSHQPMSCSEDRYHITFNGAIYNYLELRAELQAAGKQFVTASDTEVMLHAYQHWGVEFVHRLDGMYALAIWDSFSKSLFMARDPFGEKPLFFYQQQKFFGFASEANALAPVIKNPSLDRHALAEHLLFKYSPSGTPMLLGVRQLPPGSSAMLQDGCLQILSTESRRRLVDSCEALPLCEAVSNAVRIRLRADVPVGVFLSAGIDSAVIAALASQYSSNALRAYTVNFTGAGAAFSEMEGARRLAERFGLEHNSIEIGSTVIEGSMKLATRRRGAPLGEYNDIAMLKLAEAAASDVKVVLCGEGADELFGGYPRYWGEKYVTMAQRSLPNYMLSQGVKIAERMGLNDPRLAVLIRALGAPGFCERQTAWFGAMSTAQAKRLAPDLFSDFDPFQVLRERFGRLADQRDPVRAAMQFDQSVWLSENLLARGDRMTMAAPVEMRLPYLALDVVAAAQAVQTSSLFRGNQGKQNLRQGFRHLLPNEVVNRKKHGFRVPFRQWTLGPLRQFVGDHLLCGSSLLNAFVDAVRVRQIVEEHLAGRRNHEKAIWVLLSLELYLQVAREDGIATA